MKSEPKTQNLNSCNW